MKERKGDIKVKDKNKCNIIKMNRETERRIGKGERSKIEARMHWKGCVKKTITSKKKTFPALT